VLLPGAWVQIIIIPNRRVVGEPGRVAEQVAQGMVSCGRASKLLLTWKSGRYLLIGVSRSTSPSWTASITAAAVAVFASPEE
jgi:hypothetical protein